MPFYSSISDPKDKIFNHGLTANQGIVYRNWLSRNRGLAVKSKESSGHQRKHFTWRAAVLSFMGYRGTPSPFFLSCPTCTSMLQFTTAKDYVIMTTVNFFHFLCFILTKFYFS